MLLKIREYAGKLSTILGWISCVAVVVVSVFIVVSVILRYCFNKPILGSTEIVECMMAVLVFSCLAYTQFGHGHISISMVLRILPDVPAMIINALAMLVVTAFSGYVSYTLFFQGAYALGKGLKTALVLIPYAPFYYIAAVCMVVFTLILAIDTAIAFAGIVSKKYRDYVKENWS